MSTTNTTGTQTAKQEWAGGLTAFAAVMLMIAGILDICRGAMALASDDVFLTPRTYVFEYDLTGWGWVHVVLGAVAMLVSFGLVLVALWARVCGVAIAALIIIANFLSLPYYPLWSIVMITMSGFIIWALCTVRQEASADPFDRPPRNL